MATWAEFGADDPGLAAFGVERLNGKLCYLATVRRDGTPRLHPVTAIIGEGRLFLFMEPTSPKGYDLRRGSGYALHSAVQDSQGTGGEFSVRGHASPVDDAETREIAVRSSSYHPQDRYVLFELSVEGAASTVYENGGPVRQRWGEA
jgi:hypothetical protein